MFGRGEERHPIPDMFDRGEERHPIPVQTYLRHEGQHLVAAARHPVEVGGRLECHQLLSLFRLLVGAGALLARAVRLAHPGHALGVLARVRRVGGDQVVERGALVDGQLGDDLPVAECLLLAVLGAGAPELLGQLVDADAAQVLDDVGGCLELERVLEVRPPVRVLNVVDMSLVKT